MADIPFLDLRAITAEAGDALREAAARVIDSGWFILGREVEAFEADYAALLRHRVIASASATASTRSL